MKLLKNVTNLAIATVAIASFSFAQASTLTTTSDSVAAGSPATINLDWDAGGVDYRTVGTDLQYDSSVLTSVDLAECPAPGYTTGDGFLAANCTDQGAGVIRAGWALVSGGIATGRLGTIVFQTDPNATPGDYSISFLSVTVDQDPPTLVVGTVTILPPPQSAWGSNPAAGSTLDVGSHVQGTGPATVLLDINNLNGEAGSLLNGECNITSDPSDVFSFFPGGGDGPYPVVGLTNTDTTGQRAVFECDTTAAFNTYSGEVTCTHNGSDQLGPASPVTYPLSCTVTDGPQPNYSDSLSPDPMDLVAVEEGDPDPTGTLTVFNTGGARDMTVTCSYSGDSEISLAQDGVANVVPIDGSLPLAVTCDASTETVIDYSGTISCTHDDPNTASPVTHPATCAVGPPGDAVYSSVLAPGSVYDLTPPGEPVPVGTTIPTQDLVITNDPPEANDRELALLNCDLTSNIPVGDAPLDLGPISATAAVTPLAPGASTTVTFSCNSSLAGEFTDTYSCSYDVDGDGASDGTATYTVNCAIREAESEVTPDPADGTPVIIYAPLGGAGQASVMFDEVLDEDEDGTLDNCYLDDDTYFSIVSPVSYPQTITSGGSVEVLVEGMGTPEGEPTSTTLYCEYTDSQNESTQVSWPLEVVVLAAGIPTLSTWGLILMILTLLGLGGLVIRSKEHS